MSTRAGPRLADDPEDIQSRGVAVLPVASELSIHAPHSAQKAGAKAERDGSSPFADMVDSNIAQAESEASGAQTPQPQPLLAGLIAGISKAKSVKQSGPPALGKTEVAMAPAAKATETAKPQQTSIPGLAPLDRVGDPKAADPQGTQPGQPTNNAASNPANATDGAPVLLAAIADLTEAASVKKAAKSDKSSGEDAGGKNTVTPSSTDAAAAVVAIDPSISAGPSATATANPTGAPASFKKTAVKPDKSPNEIPGSKDAAKPESGADTPPGVVGDPAISGGPPAIAAAVEVAVPATTDKFGAVATNAGTSPASIDTASAAAPLPGAINDLAKSTRAPALASAGGAVSAIPAAPATAASPAIDVVTTQADAATHAAKPTASTIADVIPNSDGNAKAEKPDAVRAEASPAAPTKTEKVSVPKLQAAKLQAGGKADAPSAAPAEHPADAEQARAKAAPANIIIEMTTADATKPAFIAAADTAQPKETAAHTAATDLTNDDSVRPDPQPQADAPVRDTPVDAAKAELLRHDQQPQQDATAPKPAADALQPLTIAPSAGTAAPAAPDKASVAAPAAAVPVSGLAIEITGKVRDGKNSFDIRLDPPELGRIHVHLDVSRTGDITSHVIADRSDTLDLLRRDSGSLERALQDAGLKTGHNGLQYSLRDHSFGRNDQPTPTAASSRVIASDQTTETILPVYRVLAGARAGVDIRV
jgi:flagellar hook-length control protein FliK